MSMKQIHTENNTWPTPRLVLCLLLSLFPFFTQAQVFIAEKAEVSNADKMYVGILKTASTPIKGNLNIDPSVVFSDPSKDVHAQIVAIVNEIQKQKNKVVTAQIGDPKTEKNTKENTKKEDHYNSRNLIRAYPTFPHSPNLMYGPYRALGILTSTNYLLNPT